MNTRATLACYTQFLLNSLVLLEKSPWHRPNPLNDKLAAGNGFKCIMLFATSRFNCDAWSVEYLISSSARLAFIHNCPQRGDFFAAGNTRYLKCYRFRRPSRARSRQWQRLFERNLQSLALGAAAQQLLHRGATYRSSHIWMSLWYLTPSARCL